MLCQTLAVQHSDLCNITYHFVGCFGSLALFQTVCLPPAESSAPLHPLWNSFITRQEHSITIVCGSSSATLPWQLPCPQAESGPASGRVRPSVRPQPLPAAMDRRCRLPLPPALPGSACCESPYMAAEEQAGCSIHRKEDRQWSLPVQRQRKAGGTLSYPGPSSRDMLNL